MPPEYQDLEAAERDDPILHNANVFGIQDGQPYNGNDIQLDLNENLDNYDAQRMGQHSFADPEINLSKKYYGAYLDQDRGGPNPSDNNYQQSNYYQPSQPNRYQQQPNYYMSPKTYNGARYASVGQNSNPKAQKTYTYNSYDSQNREPPRYASLQARPESYSNPRIDSYVRPSNTPQTPRTSVQLSYAAMKNTPSSSNSNGNPRLPSNTPQPTINVQESSPSQGGRNPDRNRQRGKPRVRQGGRGRGRGNKYNKNRNNNAMETTGNRDNMFNYQADAAAPFSNSVLEEEYKGSAYSNVKPVKSVTCKDITCEGGGVCVPDKLLGGVRCQCPLGKEGNRCEKGTKTICYFMSFLCK